MCFAWFERRGSGEQQPRVGLRPRGRVDRLENLMGVLAEKQSKLDDVLVVLTEAQIRTEERFQEVGRRFQETGRRIDKLAVSLEAERAGSAARGRALDGRMEKLISAIGEMLTRPTPRPISG